MTQIWTKRYLVPLLGLLMGCSTAAPVAKQAKFTTDWSRSTPAEENYLYRHSERTAPLIDGDTVYQGNGTDGVTAYTKTGGNLKWRFKVLNGVESGFAVDGGFVYFGASDGNFYALNKNNGKLAWAFPTRSENLGQPEVVQGVVYFISGTNVLYALDAKTGKQIWNYNRGEVSSLSIRGAARPTVYKNIIYGGFSDGYLVAVNLIDGTMLWERKLSTNLKFVDVDGTPVVDEKNIWVSSYDGALYCLSRTDGQVQWRMEEGGSVAVTIEGDRLYFPSLEHAVYSLNKNTGAVIWKYVFDEKYGIPTQVVVHRGLAIFGESDGFVTAVGVNSGKKQAQYLTGNGVIASPALDAKTSSVMIFSNQANLYKLHIDWYNPETESLKW